MCLHWPILHVHVCVSLVKREICTCVYIRCSPEQILETRRMMIITGEENAGLVGTLHMAISFIA